MMSNIILNLVGFGVFFACMTWSIKTILGTYQKKSITKQTIQPVGMNDLINKRLLQELNMKYSRQMNPPKETE